MTYIGVHGFLDHVCNATRQMGFGGEIGCCEGYQGAGAGVHGGSALAGVRRFCLGLLAANVITMPDDSSAE